MVLDLALLGSEWNWMLRIGHRDAVEVKVVEKEMCNTRGSHYEVPPRVLHCCLNAVVVGHVAAQLAIEGPSVTKVKPWTTSVHIE